MTRGRGLEDVEGARRAKRDLPSAIVGGKVCRLVRFVWRGEVRGYGGRSFEVCAGRVLEWRFAERGKALWRKMAERLLDSHFACCLVLVEYLSLS